MAITVLVLGVIGTFTTFDGVRQLGMLGEKKQSATRYAQSEIESMRNMGWSNLKLNATPRPRPTRAGPSRAATTRRRACRRRPGSRRRLHPASCTSTTCVNPGPEAWTYGSASGNIYRYVTKSQDSNIYVCLAALHRPAPHHGRRHRQRAERAEVGDRQLLDRHRSDRRTDQRDPEREPRDVDRRHLDRSLDRHHVLLLRHPGRRHLRRSLGEPRDAQHDRGLRRARPAAYDGAADPGLRLRRPRSPTRPTCLRRATAASGCRRARAAPADRATTAHRWVTPVINSSAAVTATGNAALSMPTSVLSANAGQGKPGKLCIKVYSATLNGSNQVSSSTAARARTAISCPTGRTPTS